MLHFVTNVPNHIAIAFEKNPYLKIFQIISEAVIVIYSDYRN